MANALSWAGVTSPSSWASTGAGTSGDDPDCTTSGPISSTTDRKRTEGAVGCEFGVGAGVCVGDVGAGATTTAGGSAGACGSEVPAWTSVGAALRGGYHQQLNTQGVGRYLLGGRLSKGYMELNHILGRTG